MLPQDIPLDVVESVVDYVKSRHPVYETPITLSPHHTIGDALGLIHKRAHGAVVVVDEGGAPVGVFTEHDAAGFDRFTQLHAVMSRDVVTVADGIDAGDGLRAAHRAAPVARAGRRRRRPAGRRDHPQRARCARRSTARPSTPTAG